MSESSLPPETFFATAEEIDLNQPPKGSGWGLLSIFLAIFALLSLFGTTWWICGGLAFLGCTLIMLHLNRHQASSLARAMAIGGLCLSLFAISYAPTHYYLREIAIEQQAELFGNEWLKNILIGKPYRALAASTRPEIRLSETQLKPYYLDTTEGKKELNQFKNKSLVKCLLQLNGRARSNFYLTENVRVQDQSQIITGLFSVSYLETPLKKKTFFVRLVIKRSTTNGKAEWSILRFRGGVRPRKGAYNQIALYSSAIDATIRGNSVRLCTL